MVILPRNEGQEASIKSNWAEWCKNEKIIIPEHVVDGLNLLWHSDLVISGGGTMNREAAALGVPVYSIFRGKIGDVDRHLSNTGRLILLKSVEDIRTKLKIVKRAQPLERKSGNNISLISIVNEIVKVLENIA
jgi:predicted glycosyltransferase